VLKMDLPIDALCLPCFWSFLLVDLCLSAWWHQYKDVVVFLIFLDLVALVTVEDLSWLSENTDILKSLY